VFDKNISYIICDKRSDVIYEKTSNLTYDVVYLSQFFFLS